MEGVRVVAALLIVLAVAAAGCGGDDGPTAAETTAAPGAGAVLPGGGLSIEEAKRTTAEPPLAVTGWIVRADREWRLCSSLLESAPPQCGEPSLRLDGEVEGETGDRITVFGAVKGDTLVVDPTVTG
jgi:hypothetical protein